MHSVGTIGKEPYSFTLKSVAFKIPHFPFFARVEASPEDVFAFAAVSTV